MRRSTLALASYLALVGACTPLRPLDPTSEGGVRTDAARLDASALDAAGLDARGEDVGTTQDAWSDDAPSAPDATGPDAGCVGGPRCVGSVLRTCERGVATDTACRLGCLAVPAPHCGELVPSNIPAALLATGTTDYVASSGFDLDTTTCPELSLMGLTLGPVVQGDGSEVCAMAVGSLTIPDGVTMRVTGSRPFVLVAARDVTIAGTLDASAKENAAGPGGGAAGASGSAARGNAPGGPGMRGSMSTTDDGGGGGGGGCAAGGDGGDGPPSLGGRGGPGLPSTALVPLVGGSGGGAGSAGAGGSVGGPGGAGGGAVQITAGGTILVRGSILASGGAGQRGGEVMTGAIAGGGGGGGSGGGILLEAATLTLEAGSRLVTTGGGGGAGSGPMFIETDAEDGADLVRRARGGVGGGAYGANGGDSGGGATPEGLPGMDQTMMGNGGGGGGSAGCIVLRSFVPPSTTGALMSPSAAGLSTLPLMTR